MTKLLEEELIEIQTLQKGFSDLSTHIGELHIQRQIIADAIDEAEASVKAFNVRQKEFLASLQAKYGVGTISNGEFVPATQ